MKSAKEVHLGLKASVFSFVFSFYLVVKSQEKIKQNLMKQRENMHQKKACEEVDTGLLVRQGLDRTFT